jgi:hypothetical protein
VTNLSTTNIKTKFLLGLLLSLVSITSYGYVVDFNPNDATNIVGIRNLDLTIGGSTEAYDISFRSQAGGDVLVPTTAIDGGFLGGGTFGDVIADQPEAKSVSNAITLALNNWATVGDTVGATMKTSYLIPWLFNDTSCFDGQGKALPATCSERSVKLTGWNLLGQSGLEAGATVEFAQFSKCAGFCSAAVVPVPAAVWLFGSGLGFLGWVRARTRKRLPGTAATA